MNIEAIAPFEYDRTSVNADKRKPRKILFIRIPSWSARLREIETVNCDVFEIHGQKSER